MLHKDEKKHNDCKINTLQNSFCNFPNDAAIEIRLMYETLSFQFVYTLKKIKLYNPMHKKYKYL